jgi:hypothetical protein
MKQIHRILVAFSVFLAQAIRGEALGHRPAAFAHHALTRQAAIQGTEAAASGLGVNLALVGRLTGGGNTLYISTVDVTNNAATDTQVDFFLSGVDLATSDTVILNGSISSAGAAVAQGTGGPMRHRSDAHFDDFVDSLVKAGLLPSTIETDGFIGSILFVFDGFTKVGQGSASVRFYNSFGGGTIGQSLKGQEVTVSEPQKLVAVFRDSRAIPGGPQLYANLFINNMGLTPDGTGSPGSDTVHLQAYANSTGEPTGTAIDLAIAPGQTASVSDVLHRLAVPAGESTVLVYATVTSGTSAIAGAAVEIDATTKDGSVMDMNRADF